MAAETILSVIQHALGVGQYGRGDQYRSHFVCGEGHHSYETCRAAVEQGLMIRREPAMYAANGSLFLVTPAGREWMAANSPAPPKLTRSQQRYQRYLDADTSMTFREWLDHETRHPFRSYPGYASGGSHAFDDCEVPF